MRAYFVGLVFAAASCDSVSPLVNEAAPPAGTTEATTRPTDGRAAKRARYEAACRRLDAVMAAGQIGASADDLVQRVGEPTRRGKVSPVHGGGQPMFKFPAQGTDKVWTYDIEDGVAVVLHIDGARKVAEYYSTGVRFFEAKLFRDDPSGEGDAAERAPTPDRAGGK